VRYYGKTWLEAEQFFMKVHEANINDSPYRQNVEGDMYLISDIFHVNKKRYTGIFSIDINNRIDGSTGMNFDHLEWLQLMNIYPKIKQILYSVDDNKSVPVKRKLSYDETMNFQLYQTKYFVDGEEFQGIKPKEYYSEEQARIQGMKECPVAGIDFKDVLGKVELKINPVDKSPPEHYELMQAIYVLLLKKKILALTEENCPGCAINSPSQVDHLEKGCQDEEFNHVVFYIDSAIAAVKTIDLDDIFCKCRKEMNLTPVISKPYAISAQKYLSPTSLIQHISEFESKVPLYIQNLLTVVVPN